MDELSKDVGVVALDGADMTPSAMVVGGGGGGAGGVGSPSASGVAPPDGGYLDGLLREKDALNLGAGMDLTKRLVNQGESPEAGVAEGAASPALLLLPFLLLCFFCFSSVSGKKNECTRVPFITVILLSSLLPSFRRR